MNSRCCAAPVEAIHEDEGQSYWLCTSCHNQCGVTDEYQKLNHMINHSTDTAMRYDKGLPQKRRMKYKYSVSTLHPDGETIYVAGDQKHINDCYQKVKWMSVKDFKNK